MLKQWCRQPSVDRHGQNVLLIGMARRLVALLALVTLRGVAALQRPRRPASLHRLRRGASPTHAWSNQDLTTDNAGCEPIPDDDYVKQYQRDPALWPVEFFVIVYRRRGAAPEALVRRSANGTSKWGLGSGCPATRWAPSSSAPPRGYERSGVSFDARNFPQFRSAEPWSYDKIDVRADAFDGEDPELREFARWIRRGLRARFAEEEEAAGSRDESEWDASLRRAVKRVLDEDNSVAAIQGSLRMSGLFARDRAGNRYAPLHALVPVEFVESAQIYAMFPQMPDPLPPPSATAEELREEMESRAARMAESGRDPHADEHGRVYTHISTPNVSNTILGVYMTLDATGLRFVDDRVPAFDLFGTAEVEREWVSLEDLKVLKGGVMSAEDPKPTFISGFVVRQLVEDGVIDVRGDL